jgi:hypothetical protein
LRQDTRKPPVDKSTRTSQTQRNNIRQSSEELYRKYGGEQPGDVASQMEKHNMLRPARLRGIVRGWRKDRGLNVQPKNHLETWSTAFQDYINTNNKEEPGILRFPKYCIGETITHFTMLFPTAWQFLSNMKDEGLVPKGTPCKCDATFYVEWQHYVFNFFVVVYYRFLAGRWRKIGLPLVCNVHPREDKSSYSISAKVLHEECVRRSLPVLQLGSDHV